MGLRIPASLLISPGGFASLHHRLISNSASGAESGLQTPDSGLQTSLSHRADKSGII
jgi:hypothetical protein